MWISLDRVCACDQQDQFILLNPGWFTVHSTILCYLFPAEGHLFLRSCILLVIDRSDLFLSATALRIQYSRSGYSVPTPPLEPYIVLHQVGVVQTVWDQDSSALQSSRSSLNSLVNSIAVVHNALEDENPDTLQGDIDA